MVKLDIPLNPMKHAYIVTEPIEEVKDVPNIRDHDFKIYFKAAGETLSIGGYEINPIFLRTVSFIKIIDNMLKLKKKTYNWFVCSHNHP